MAFTVYMDPREKDFTGALLSAKNGETSDVSIKGAGIYCSSRRSPA